MALHTEADGSIKLRTGTGAIWSHLARRYGADPQVLDETIGGSVRLLVWRYNVAGVDYAAVASAGLERLPFVGEPATEVVVEVRESQLGAAVIAVRIIVERAVQELQAPWELGRVWMNDGPVLTGTHIRAIVVATSGDGDSVDLIRDDAGAVAGRLQTGYLLTYEEARAVSQAGLAPLEHARAVNRAELANVERSADVFVTPAAAPTPVPPASAPASAPAVAAPAPAPQPVPAPAPQPVPTPSAAPLPVVPPAPSIPTAPGATPPSAAYAWPERPVAGAGLDQPRSRETLQSTAILVTKHVWNQPIGWIEKDEDGRFRATTQTETEAELNDPQFLEIASLTRVIALNPWLEQFALSAAPRDFATFDKNGQFWFVGTF